MHVQTSRVDQRTAEADALGTSARAGHDIQRARKLRRREGQNRRRVLWLAVDVFLPIGLGRGRISRLFISNHRVRVIKHGRRRIQPIGSRLPRQSNQKPITRAEIDR